MFFGRQDEIRVIFDHKQVLFIKKISTFFLVKDIFACVLNLGMLRTKLRKARRDRGLTQKKLSVLAGISQPLIAKYELGHKPSINNLRRICEALEVPIDFFNKSTNEKEAIEFDERFFELMLEKTKKLSLAKKKVVINVITALLDYQSLQDSINDSCFRPHKVENKEKSSAIVDLSVL